MTSTPRSIPAALFRNECLKLLDEVEATGDTVVVTKHGRPVAAVVPIDTQTADSVIGWAEEMVLDIDLAEPAIAPEHWHVVGDPTRVLPSVADDGAG